MTNLVGANLDRIYWTDLNTDVKKKKSKPYVPVKKDGNNLLALIINCITKNIPETSKMSEKDFVHLQDEIQDILNLNK